MRPKARLILAGVLLLLLAACGSPPLAQPYWPVPVDPMARAEAAGLTPEPEEHLTTHTHAHLDVFVDGERIEVPSAIGIDIEATGIEHRLSDDGTAHEYYLPATCDEPCLSPLHTHDPGGIIHTESKEADQQPYTLGQFFTEWGLPLTADCVGQFCKADTTIAVYLDGEQDNGNPADVELTSLLEIAIVIGKPPGEIPDSYPFHFPE